MVKSTPHHQYSVMIFLCACLCMQSVTVGLVGHQEPGGHGQHLHRLQQNHQIRHAFVIFKVTGHSKIKFFGRVSPNISARLFCYITCIFKRPSLRIFWFKISQFVPFCMKTPKNPQKGTNCDVHLYNKKVLYWLGKP